METTLLRRVHRLSGAVLGVFLLAHMANNFAALAGPAAHRQMLDALRTVYRFPPAEALLLACVVVQLMSGLRMVRQGWGKWQGAAGRAQYWSGAYLAFFLVAHSGAVLAARGIFGIDTDWKFAMAGIDEYHLGFFFVPYYLLAVISLGVHIACALRPRRSLHPAASAP